MFWSWLHWQDIQVLYVMVTLTGYSSIECFGHGYIDRIFNTGIPCQCNHDIQHLNILGPKHSILEYPVNVTMTYNTWISCQCNHDLNIQYWNILSPVLNVFVVVTLTGYSSIECFCRGYIDRVFQYWMFWSWPWPKHCILEYPVNVTMTKTLYTGIACQCNHDQNIQYWNTLLM
jgi:hypothetical protein